MAFSHYFIYRRRGLACKKYDNEDSILTQTIKDDIFLEINGLDKHFELKD